MYFNLEVCTYILKAFGKCSGVICALAPEVIYELPAKGHSAVTVDSCLQFV